MSLREGVARKAFNLPPDLSCQFGGVTLCGAVGKELVAHLLEFLPRTVLARHATSQYIRFSEAQPGQNNAPP